MLKTSWSIEAESSTTTTTSVWGLKYIPGRRTASSRSTTWPSRSASGVIASRLSPSRLRLLPQVLELAELTLDLGVRGRRGCLLGANALHLRLDVERALPADPLAVGLRLEELAQFGIAHLGRGIGVGVGHLLRQVVLELHRELPLADLAERASGAKREGECPDRDRGEDDHQDRLSVRERGGELCEHSGERKRLRSSRFALPFRSG